MCESVKVRIECLLYSGEDTEIYSDGVDCSYCERFSYLFVVLSSVFFERLILCGANNQCFV